MKTWIVKGGMLLAAAALTIGALHPVRAENGKPSAPESRAIPGRWSADKAWEWYRKQPWPCGFNYVPANAISYTEMWMADNFDSALIDQELALGQATGFNCLRVVLPFVVWEAEPEAFKKRFATFLGICAKRGIRVMPALFDDCAFGSDPKLENPWCGKQPEVLKGWYANGWTPSPGHDLVRTSSTWPRLEKYVKDLLATFGNDDRVWVWDLYNEPGNGGLGAVSYPLLEKVIRWARETAPTQPLTVGWWNRDPKLNQIIYTNSDVIAFHDYSPPESLASHLKELQNQGRPMICTEWLHRNGGSTVAGCLGLFKQAGVGALHWGLVNGKTQTNLNWGHRPGQPDPKLWQHDLFRGDHTPYDKEEIALFKNAIGNPRPAEANH